MTLIPHSYVAEAEAFAEYVRSLIDEHPDILEMDDPRELLLIKDFKHPTHLSFYQASWALDHAQALYLKDR